MARNFPINMNTDTDTPRTVVKPVRNSTTPTLKPRTGLTPMPPPPRGPNQGGTITRGGAITAYAPSAYAPPAHSTTTNAGGTITAGNRVVTVAPSPYTPPTPKPVPPSGTDVAPVANPAATAPVESPTTSAAPQTEASNPLTGAGNAQPPGTTDAVNPGLALGAVQRGTSVPAGQDALPGEHMGGTGLYARKFSNPKAASIYSGYVRRLFGDEAGVNVA